MSQSKDKGYRRVVVTGMGAVSPLGLNVEDTWKAMLAGRSGVGPITLFDASEFPTRIAGEVKDFDFDYWTKEDEALAQTGRSTYFALAAADEAVAAAGLASSPIDAERFGVYFGAGDSGIDFAPFVKTMADSMGTEHPAVDKGLYLEASSRHMNALRELESQPFMMVTHLARRYGIRGPASNCLTACAASSQALGEAFEWIRRGDVDVVLSGGSNSMVYPLSIAGFSSLNALSTRNDEPEKASRPFDKKRNGFVLGEGAGVLILEELEHARSRGAKIHGEIIGYGSTADAYRLTDMDPEGRSAIRAVEMAMRKGDLAAEAVDYINAHGTSTLVNDQVETRVIKQVLGEHAKHVPVSSIKSMLGHLITAAGVLELITCFLTMRDSVIPPTINYDDPDPACDLDYVPNKARACAVKTALSNSFGFGGQNICMAVRKYEE